MGSGRNDSPGSGNPGPSGESDPSTTAIPSCSSTRDNESGGERRPIRFLRLRRCSDAFRHLFGTRVAVAYQNETKLIGQMLYSVLTTGSRQQTLGEEYCDITQDLMAFPLHLLDVSLLVYQTAVPYIAERIRILLNFRCAALGFASRGITLAELQSDEFYSNNASERSQVESSTGIEISLPSESTASVSALSRLKEKLRGMWLHAVQRWPAV